MRRDLIKFVTLLNENEKSFYDNCFVYSIKEDFRVNDYGIPFDQEFKEYLKAPCYSLEIRDTDFNELYLTLYTKGRYERLEDNIQSLIGAVYSQELNERKSYITNFKGAYLTRKMKSLSKALEKNDIEKIMAINKEMIEKFELMEKYKMQVNDFKILVSRLYEVKDELFPKEKGLEENEINND